MDIGRMYGPIDQQMRDKHSLKGFATRRSFILGVPRNRGTLEWMAGVYWRDWKDGMSPVDVSLSY